MDERVQVEKEPNRPYWWVLVDGNKVGACSKREDALDVAERVRIRIANGERP